MEMRPIGYRCLAQAGLVAAILFSLPGAEANVVDLGVVAYNTGVNAAILFQSSINNTYTFQQLLFSPSAPLNMVFDDGRTLAQVLADDLGPEDNGTLTYNFPFAGGASGVYTLSTPPIVPSPSDPNGNIGPGIFDSITAQTQSGVGCPGYNTPGSTIGVDPTNSAATFLTILGCESLGSAAASLPTSTTTNFALPPLGTVTDGSTVTVYEGEVIDTQWQAGGVVLSPQSTVPEPSTGGLIVTAIVCAGAIRLRKRRPS
jgi:hypothetical protein